MGGVGYEGLWGGGGVMDLNAQKQPGRSTMAFPTTLHIGRPCHMNCTCSALEVRGNTLILTACPPPPARPMPPPFSCPATHKRLLGALNGPQVGGGNLVSTMCWPNLTAPPALYPGPLTDLVGPSPARMHSGAPPPSRARSGWVKRGRHSWVHGRAAACPNIPVVAVHQSGVAGPCLVPLHRRSLENLENENSGHLYLPRGWLLCGM